jgi:hypothetical protein
VRSPDPDSVLVEEMLAPPPLDDARRSLEYWERRRQSLRLHQRAARREAREMAARWEARVRAAERVHFESTVFGRILVAVGLSGLWAQRLALRKGRLLSVAWALMPRPLRLAAYGLVAAWLLVAVLTVAVLAAVAGHLG